MRKKNKLVYGVGFNDFEGSITFNKKAITSYSLWVSMLQRCYSKKLHNKAPTYIGCTVCTEWLTFSNFKQWHDNNYREGMQLDKDILVEGNKIYSSATCRYIPAKINSILNDRRNARGDLPLGIRSHKKKYFRGQCSIGNSERLTRSFKTLEEAVTWYSETKARIVSEVAQRALAAGEIQQDIFNALVARKF